MDAHVSLHPEAPFHLPPHPIPLGCPRAPALSALLHAWNLHRSSILHMVIYMLQCYFLTISHPCLFPQSLKVCSLYLCLSCCLAYRIIDTIFLNSIYICINILYWCFFFWLTSLCIIGSSFIYCSRTDSNAFFFIAEWYSIMNTFLFFFIISVKCGNLMTCFWC